ncbi:MAG TPA: radical SAM protein [Prolixibacteraceae bacterium]|nr:radical SAM protein [Prolixibacteraceae bacterium]
MMEPGQNDDHVRDQPEKRDQEKRLRILVCKPRLAIQTIRLNKFIRCEPLELEYLYTVLKHHELFFLDGITDRRNPVRIAKKLKPQVVLFTTLITTATDVLKTAAALKKLDHPPLIFIGGPHAEVVPEHFFTPDIDGVFFANQLEGIVRVTDCIVRGEPYDSVAGAAFPVNGKFVIHPSPPVDPSKMPRPVHYLLEKSPARYNIIYYKPCAAIKTSFGCTGKCTFCFCTEMNGGLFGARPMEDVMDEIAEISVPHIIILDDNFFSSGKRMREFCDLIEKRKIQKEFIAIGNARFIVQNPDIMSDLRKAGVKAVMVGFEFITEEELTAIDKDSTPEDNNRVIDICRDLDIDLFALFMVNPDWQHSDFKKLALYLRSHKVPFALFSTLTVFPGTKLARLHPELLPTHTKFWRYDLLRLHQKPRHMSSTMFYLWLFYLYMIPGMQFTSIRKFRQRYGITGVIRHSFTSFFMGLEYLVKLLIWK